MKRKKKDNSCDQCTAAMINGVFCHEIGCPNMSKVKRKGRWVNGKAKRRKYA